MSSEEKPFVAETTVNAGASAVDGAGTETGAGAGQPGDATAGRPRAQQFQVNDPAVMRALTHPLRWALLEALTHAGTLTATQAGEILGETPANCAFHLRTLARYGLVEEAGGGKGRERPWRRATAGFTMTLEQDDPQAAAAAGVLNEWWLNTTLERARATLQNQSAWPAGLAKALASTQSLRYLTVAEAGQMQADLLAVLDRYVERNDDPSARPPGALPVDFLLLTFPLLDLVSRPNPPADPSDESDESD
jgi:predicted transcriptional regulator